MRGNTKNMLKQELIENALALTGKTMEDMNEFSSVETYRDVELMETKVTPTWYKFSIEKLCYYLLSPEFIYEYMKVSYTESIIDIAISIREYQRKDIDYPNWNEEPITNLLSKI